LFYFFYGLLVPDPITFLPLLSFGESFIIVLLFEIMLFRKTEFLQVIYLENMNYIANTLHAKEVLKQKIINELYAQHDKANKNTKEVHKEVDKTDKD